MRRIVCAEEGRRRRDAAVERHGCSRCDHQAERDHGGRGLNKAESPRWASYERTVRKMRAVDDRNGMVEEAEGGKVRKSGRWATASSN
jgi:hypothetical protein